MAPKTKDAQGPVEKRDVGMGRVTPLTDLEARVKLLAEYGVKYYKDGILELHLEGRPGKRPADALEGFKV